MSFSRYPKYKDSGVEWLGEVPEHWKTKRIGYYFTERREKVSDKDYPPLSVTMGGIVPQIETAAKTDDSDNRKKVCIGDFVINSRSDRKGSAGVSELEGSVSLISTVLRPHDKNAVHMPFAHHLLRSQPFQEEFYRNGKGIVADLWSTNFLAMRNILLSLPDPAEQTAIAAFLDRETAKIDGLVAEQRRLVELLKEKRQAVISHAVTKGLNRDAPMKPSGIEWLGDVPEHWNRSKPKYFTTKIVDGVHFKPTYVDEGIPFVTVRNLTAGLGISFENLNFISEEDHEEYFQRANPERGDVLLTKDGATLGIARVVDTDRVFSIFVSVALLKPIKELIDPWFLCYALESTVVFQQFKAGELGSALKHIHLVDLRNVSVSVPPLEEQREIVRVLDIEIRKLEALVDEAQRAIDLLLERRTALISAAVTGQIDLRQLASKEESA